MSTSQRPDQGASPQAQPQRDRQPIPIRILWFRQPTDVPGKTGGSAAKAGKQGSNETTIDFRPWLRMYCVTFIEHGKPPVSRLIPESWASSEPLDGVPR